MGFLRRLLRKQEPEAPSGTGPVARQEGAVDARPDGTGDTCPQQEPQYPYESFLLDFSALGERPSPKVVTGVYPQGELRLKAFEYLHTKYPEDLGYLWHYVQGLVKSGVYDETAYQRCFSLVDRGLSLPDQGGIHARLQRLREQLEKSLRDSLEELGDAGLETSGPDELGRLLRAKRYDELIAMFEEMRNSHQPRGILGGERDQRFWALHQLAIHAYFEKRDYRQALLLMEEFEAKRVRVGLTPIPDYNVQERAIGCLAQMSLPRATEKLRFWIENSKVPIVSALIKHHPAFRELFPAD